MPRQSFCIWCSCDFVRNISLNSALDHQCLRLVVKTGTLVHESLMAVEITKKTNRYLRHIPTEILKCSCARFPSGGSFFNRQKARRVILEGAPIGIEGSRDGDSGFSPAGLGQHQGDPSCTQTKENEEGRTVPRGTVPEYEVLAEIVGARSQATQVGSEELRLLLPDREAILVPQRSPAP